MNYEIVNNLIKDVISGKTNYVATEDIKAVASSGGEAQEIIDFIENMGIMVMTHIEHKGYKMLSPQDEARLVIRYQNGEKARELLNDCEGLDEEKINQLNDLIRDREKAFEILVDYYRPFIAKVVQKFTPVNRSQYDDFTQSALCAFADALRVADFEHFENMLSTFCWHKMMASVQDQKERFTASNPASHTFLYNRKKYFDYKKKCEQNGEELDYYEIAKILKCKVTNDKDLYNLQQKILLFENYQSCASLQSEVNDDSSEKKIEMSELLEDKTEDVLTRKINEERSKCIINWLKEFLTEEQAFIYQMKSMYDYKIDPIVDYLNSHPEVVKKINPKKVVPYTKSTVSSILGKARSEVDARKEELRERLEKNF